jgi:hypothetical protein
VVAARSLLPFAGNALVPTALALVRLASFSSLPPSTFRLQPVCLPRRLLAD